MKYGSLLSLDSRFGAADISSLPLSSSSTSRSILRGSHIPSPELDCICCNTLHVTIDSNINAIKPSRRGDLNHTSMNPVSRKSPSPVCNLRHATKKPVSDSPIRSQSPLSASPKNIHVASRRPSPNAHSPPSIAESIKQY